MTDDMSETLSQIENSDSFVSDQKSSLLANIKNIEEDIRTAQQEINNNDFEPTAYAATSPEVAQKQHRNLVFLKRALEKLKSEFAQLL